MSKAAQKPDTDVLCVRQGWFRHQQQRNKQRSAHEGLHCPALSIPSLYTQIDSRQACPQGINNATRRSSASRVGETIDDEFIGVKDCFVSDRRNDLGSRTDGIVLALHANRGLGLGIPRTVPKEVLRALPSTMSRSSFCRNWSPLAGSFRT